LYSCVFLLTALEFCKGGLFGFIWLSIVLVVEMTLNEQRSGYVPNLVTGLKKRQIALKKNQYRNEKS